MRAPSAIWQRGSIVGWVWLDRRGENEKRGAQESVPHGSLIERLSFAQGKVDKRRADSIFYCAVSRIASGVKFHLAAGTEPSLSNRTTIRTIPPRGFHGFLRAARHTWETGFDIIRSSPIEHDASNPRRLFVRSNKTLVDGEMYVCTKLFRLRFFSKIVSSSLRNIARFKKRKIRKKNFFK